jgi:hypothetical protein
MNQFTQILEKAASQLGLDFKISKSDKSEAGYLLLKSYSNSDFNNVYSCLGVRLASHDATTERSLAYEVQLDCGFNFDYSSKLFSTTWGIDEDGDFSECSLDDELFFQTEVELINYMSNCLTIYLKNKLN